jgi:2-polyprenyl-3-methyl-5-hydroxy-6-metoxy-1,4-benzoquinol methylase
LTPDPFLIWADAKFIGPAFPQGGNVIDVAGGVGRHAIYFARKRWNATLLDISEAGLRFAEQIASKERLTITLVEADLDEFHLKRWKRQFDLVLVFFYLQRELFPALEQLPRPGGFLIYKTYLHSETNRGGPTHPLHLLQRGELQTALPALEVLHFRENISERSTAELVARRKAEVADEC